MNDYGVKRPRRGRRAVGSGLALAVMAAGLAGCSWKDFRKRVTLRYQEHAATLAWKSEQKALLETYDVVDKDSGKYRIPVSVALQAVAKDPALLAPLVKIETDLSGMTIAQKGENHFKITYACGACHDLAGERKVGPALNKRWGTLAKVQKADNPAEFEEIPFDDAYFRESVFYSQKRIAWDYPAGAMPVFEGQMTEEDFESIKAYVAQFQ